MSLFRLDKASNKIPAECSDYADIFLFDLAIKLSKNTDTNEHAIELVEDKQPFYGSIYTPNSVKLEILKTYIETHLKTGFIQPSKFPTGTPISFNKKPDSFLPLYIHYQSLNNLIIKNRYLLPPIDEYSDRLGRAKRFI